MSAAEKTIGRGRKRQPEWFEENEGELEPLIAAKNEASLLQSQVSLHSLTAPSGTTGRLSLTTIVWNRLSRPLGGTGGVVELMECVREGWPEEETEWVEEVPGGGGGWGGREHYSWGVGYQ